MSDWGKGVINNIGWGQGANNDIGWGSIYDKSFSGDTLLGGGSGYNANYQAVIDYANSEEDTLPSSNIQIAQNKWFEAINPFFNKSIDFARLSKADYYNSPSFLVNGIKGNGTSSYVDLNFDADAITNINSLTFGVFAPNGIVGNGGFKGIMGGSNNANRGIMLLLDGDNKTRASVNSNLLSFNSLITNDLISATSNGSTGTYRIDEVTLDTESISTQFKSSQSIYLLCRNFNGDALQFIDDIISVSFIADELTASELGILSAATKNYLNEI
jgi:hypothetical protein